MAPGAGNGDSPQRAPLPAPDADSGDDPRDCGGERPRHRLHAAAGQAPDIVRIVEGISGRVPMRSELIIRFDYGHIVPWVRRIDDARVAIAGPDALCLRTPADVRGEAMTTISDFVVEPAIGCRSC